VTATIVTNKGGGPVVGSMRLTGAEVSTPVTFSNLDNTGVLGWKWEVIDTPAQSPTLNPIPAEVFTPTTILANDVKGHSVLMRLTTYSDAARTILDDVDQVVLDVQFDPPFDWVIPAAGQSLEVDDIRGWASDINRILREVNAFMTAGGGAGSPGWKDPVRLVNEMGDGALKDGDFTRVGAVITADANGAMPNIDGVAPVVGDSLLMYKAFTGAASVDAGIYVIDDLGSAGTPYQMTRRDDFDEDSELFSRTSFVVQEGDEYARTLVQLSNLAPIAINIDQLTFDFQSMGELNYEGSPGAGGVVEAPGATFSASPNTVHRWSGLGANVTANLPNFPPHRTRVGFLCNASSAGELIVTGTSGKFIDGPTGDGLSTVTVRGRGSYVELLFDGFEDRWRVVAGGEYVIFNGTTNSILNSGTGANPYPQALTVPADRLVGRISGGDLAALTVGQVQTLLGVVTGAVPSTLFDANTILAADVDDTPTARTIAGSQVVGRVNAGGSIGGISIFADSLLRADGAGALASASIGADALVGRVGSNDIADLAAAVQTYYRRAAGSLGTQAVADSEFLGRPAGGDLGVITKAQAEAILSDFPLLDGTRAFTGTVGGVTPTQPAHLATKQYTDSVASGIEWQDSVFDRDLVTAPAAVAGDRYIAAGTGGLWSPFSVNDIVEYDGAAWSGISPTLGMVVGVDDEARSVRWNGAAWAFFGTTVDHGNLANVAADDHHNQQHAIGNARSVEREGLRRDA
jgi:hypothetical protein